MQHSSAFWFGAIVGGLVGGLLCGLAPLIAGFNKNRHSLAWAGFASCSIAGLLFGILLAGPVAVVFTIVILVQPASPPPR